MSVVKGIETRDYFLGVFRQSVISMLVLSCDHKEKQVIKEHFILNFEAISFKWQKVIAILSYSLVFMFVSYVTMSSNSAVTKIHSLHKFGVILVKQYQVMEVFVPKPRFHVGDFRLILKPQ